MKNALIILNGECKDYNFLKALSLNADYIICADGGAKHALKCEIKPNLVLGDFDSSEFIEDFNAEIKTYPVEKDKTDGEIAVLEAKEKGFDKIILTCALGGRQDHTLANLMLLDENVYINEVSEEIYCISESKTFKMPLNTTFSIIPVKRSNISVDGCKYNLENTDIDWGNSLTLSNISLKDEIEIKVNFGKILIFINK